VHITRSILAGQAQAGATALVSRLLERARDAAEKIGNADDPDALHSFRVSVRQLRNAQRVFAPLLGRAASKGARKRLRDVAGATNMYRDAQVQQEWLRARLSRKGLGAAERLGLQLLMDDVDRQLQSDAARHLREAVSAFNRVAKKLHRRLQRLPADRPDEKDAHSFGDAIADQIASLAEGLLPSLSRIGEQQDRQLAHEARLAIKKLRYLLDPVQRRVSRGRRTVRQFKLWQDRLGSVHDLFVLQDRIIKLMSDLGSRWAVEMAAAVLEGSGGVRQSLPRSSHVVECQALARVLATVRRARDREMARFAVQATASHITAMTENISEITTGLRDANQRPSATLTPAV